MSNADRASGRRISTSTADSGSCSLAGRRVTEIAEVRSGLLTGWHDRSRGWWGDAAGADNPAHCSASGSATRPASIRGEHFAFLEMFEAVRVRRRSSYCPDDALVHCAPVLTDQLLRTPAADRGDRHRLRDDVLDRCDHAGAGRLDFCRSACCQRCSAPLSRTATKFLLGADCDTPDPPKRCSCRSTPSHRCIFRHRKLGYALYFHEFRLKDLGPRGEFGGCERVSNAWSDRPRISSATTCVLIDTVRERAEHEDPHHNVMSTVG